MDKLSEVVRIVSVALVEVSWLIMVMVAQNWFDEEDSTMVYWVCCGVGADKRGSRFDVPFSGIILEMYDFVCSNVVRDHMICR